MPKHKKKPDLMRKFGKFVHSVGGRHITNEDVGIYAPCPMGATLNDATVIKIKAKVITGATNNQLADENVHAAILQERGAF